MPQRLRQLYGLVEDLNTLPLRARLAKQLLHLTRSYGVMSLDNSEDVPECPHDIRTQIACLNNTQIRSFGRRA